MPLDLHTNSSGNVVIQPLTEWETRSLAGVAVLLVVQYAKDQSEAEAERPTGHVQLGLNPEQALELAESLKRTATLLLDRQADATKPLN